MIVINRFEFPNLHFVISELDFDDFPEVFETDEPINTIMEYELLLSALSNRELRAFSEGRYATLRELNKKYNIEQVDNFINEYIDEHCWK